MASMRITKRKRYYYLQHSFRKKGKVITKESYLGTEIPEDIEKRKETFLRQHLESEAFKKLDSIKTAYNQEWKRIPPSIQKKMLVDLSIEFTYNTNAIEGSTITLEETEELIKHRMAPHKDIRDIQETIRHSELFFRIIKRPEPISNETILQWHKELFSDTKPDMAGRYRDYLVRVGPYLAPDWQDIKRLMNEFLQWLSTNSGSMHPVELAARAHYKFEKIHPFGDGNGRTGRLIIAIILQKADYPPLIIEYKRRMSYYKALSKKENDFLTYFIRRYLRAHQRYIKK